MAPCASRARATRYDPVSTSAANVDRGCTLASTKPFVPASTKVLSSNGPGPGAGLPDEGGSGDDPPARAMCRPGPRCCCRWRSGRPAAGRSRRSSPWRPRTHRNRRSSTRRRRRGERPSTLHEGLSCGWDGPVARAVPLVAEPQPAGLTSRYAVRPRDAVGSPWSVGQNLSDGHRREQRRQRGRGALGVERRGERSGKQAPCGRRWSTRTASPGPAEVVPATRAWRVNASNAGARPRSPSTASVPSVPSARMSLVLEIAPADVEAEVGQRPDGGGDGKVEDGGVGVERPHEVGSLLLVAEADDPRDRRLPHGTVEPPADVGGATHVDDEAGIVVGRHAADGAQCPDRGNVTGALDEDPGRSRLEDGHESKRRKPGAAAPRISPMRTSRALATHHESGARHRVSLSSAGSEEPCGDGVLGGRRTREPGTRGPRWPRRPRAVGRADRGRSRRSPRV